MGTVCKQMLMDPRIKVWRVVNMHPFKLLVPVPAGAATPTQLAHGALSHDSFFFSGPSGMLHDQLLCTIGRSMVAGHGHQKSSPCILLSDLFEVPSSFGTW